MKRDELIQLLRTIPEDAEIVVGPNGDDICGDYRYCADIQITENEAFGEGLETSYSNYRRKNDLSKKVWVLQ